MKNRITPDFIIPVEMDELKNGQSEIVDDIYPVHRFTEDIKKKVYKALDMNEFQKMMSLSPNERVKYLQGRDDFNF